MNSTTTQDIKRAYSQYGVSVPAMIAAERIVDLDGIRPHVLVDGDTGHMAGVVARIIQAELAEWSKRNEVKQ